MKNVWKTLAFAGALVMSATTMRADSLIGGNTAVTLNSATATTLETYFTLGTVAPATLSGLTATFPITGDTATTISHSGGLSLTGLATPAGVGTTVDVEDFVIDTSVNKIFGTVVAGSSSMSGVALFDIGPGMTLTLDNVLAGDISAVYGVSGLDGVLVGTAMINPVSTSTSVTPEPSSLSLLALGAASVAGFARRRIRTAS